MSSRCLHRSRRSVGRRPGVASVITAAVAAAVASLFIVGVAVGPVAAHEGDGTDRGPATVVVSPAPTDDRCAGTVVSGATLTVSGDGFVPGSTVTVTAGSAAHGRVPVPAVRVSGSGAASAQVPVGASSSAAAAAFTVELAGPGPDGHPVVRAASVSWQPSGSVCADQAVQATDPGAGSQQGWLWGALVVAVAAGAAVSVSYRRFR